MPKSGLILARSRRQEISKIPFKCAFAKPCHLLISSNDNRYAFASDLLKLFSKLGIVLNILFTELNAVFSKVAARLSTITASSSGIHNQKRCISTGILVQAKINRYYLNRYVGITANLLSKS